MSNRPGWYNDGAGSQRYWDGKQWTDQVLPGPPGPNMLDGAPVPLPPELRGVRSGSGAVPGVDGGAGAGAAGAGDASGGGFGVTSAPARKKSRVGLWIGLGVGGFVLLILGGVAAFVMFVVNATSGPRESVDALLKGLYGGNCHAVYTHVAENLHYGLDEDEYCMEYGPIAVEGFSHSVTRTSITNDTAVVVTKETFSYDDSKETSQRIYQLVKVDGEWLVTSVAGSSS